MFDLSRTKFSVLLVLVAGMIFFPNANPADAQAPVLYAVNSRVDGLYTIDNIETGELTFIGELDSDDDKLVTPVAMAVRPSDGKIFVWNNNDTGSSTGVLLTVDPCTGQATAVNSSAPPQGQMGALAFAPDGTLYGCGKMKDSALYKLFTIDTGNGTRTPVDDSNNLRFQIAGAAFDSTGKLYGIELTSYDSYPSLVTIDTSTGTGSTPVPLDKIVGVIGSIVFTPDGTLLGSGTDGPLGDIIFEIDPSTGAVGSDWTIDYEYYPQGMGYSTPCEPAILVPDQINDVIPDTAWECFPSGTFSLNQSFTPQVSPLVAIDLLFWKAGNFPDSGYSTTIRIRSNSISGSILGESTVFILEDDLPMIRFHFFPEIQVIPGNTYVIEWITPSPEQQIIHWASAQDSYEGGRAYGCLGNPIIPEADFIFITYSIINTEEGENVVVQPTDAATGDTPVTLTFDQVDGAGATSLSTSEEGESLETGFKLGDPPTYYEITTTAEYTGSITVCIDYTGVEYVNEGDLAVYHYVEGEWVAAQLVSHDTDNDVICVIVDSLSPFVIVEPVLRVEIDIRPFSRHNIVVPWSWGLIPVAIMSTNDFNAPEMVDKSSLTFGHTGYEVTKFFCIKRTRDVNRDGLRDIVCFFRTRLGDFQCDDTEGILRGITKDGMPIEGRDTVRIKCKKGKKIYKKKKW